MTGAKAFRQKGTGRARAGALSVPQRKGGGVAFGPKPRGYAVKVNRKARRRALRAALTLHAERGSLAVIEASAFDSPSTRKASEALDGFGQGRALVVFAREGEEAAVKSFRNLRQVEVLPADAVGVADIVGAARLVLSDAALEGLTRVAKSPADDLDVVGERSGLTIRAGHRPTHRSSGIMSAPLVASLTGPDASVAGRRLGPCRTRPG